MPERHDTLGKILQRLGELMEENAALKEQVNFAYAANRELTFELSIRDGVISDLQNRLAVLEDHAEAVLAFSESCGDTYGAEKARAALATPQTSARKLT